MRTLLLLLAAVGTAAADVKLPSLFADGMVLQADAKVAVWGRADPGEAVTVAFEDQSAQAKADAEGRWRVEIGPFTYTAERLLVVTGKNRIEIEDVCVGEVWVCSGQSNMQWPLAKTTDAGAAIAAAANPRLRLFTMPRRVADTPQAECGGTWQPCTPETAGPFSAVAYYFGLRLREELGVPVGLIHSSWGGTPAEAWTSLFTLQALPELAPTLQRWDAALSAWPEKDREFRAALAEWKKTRQGRRPRPPVGPQHPSRPAGLYNAMIAPLTPFAVRGVIWYQGEANAGRAWQYRTLFPALIRDWRRAWKRPLPFGFVQLANFQAIQPRPGEHPWAELREAQALALREPRTGMAVTIDIGEANSIHPRNKRDVGGRLARWALARVYGKDIEYSGPVYARHTTRDGRVRIEFEHAAGLRTRLNEPLTGFAIAGADKQWRWAHARIDGRTVVVWHPDIAEPAAVRYAWAVNPVCNLINGEGLPAAPFRTDNWPLTTRNNR